MELFLHKTETVWDARIGLSLSFVCVFLLRGIADPPPLLRVLAYVGGGAIQSRSRAHSLFDVGQVSVQSTVSDFLPTSYNTTWLGQSDAAYGGDACAFLNSPHSPLGHFSLAHRVCVAVLTPVYVCGQFCHTYVMILLTPHGTDVPALQSCMEVCRQLGSTRGRTVAE